MNMNFQLEHIDQAARAFIGRMDGRNVFAFRGPMGAGKTTFIKAVCEALGVTDTINSPTFAIMNEYRAGGGRRICHFDFYRIADLREAADLGLDDYFSGDDLCLMEWAENIGPLLPANTVWVDIKEEPDGSRSLSFV
jgi:tRNA threonylcarbamoyladenosine biosynthesis protein TsaE